MKRDLFSQSDIARFSLENPGRKIYHEFKGIGRLSRLTKRNLGEKCELIIYEGKVTFRVKGSEIYYLVRTNGNCRVELYYTDLLEALENDRFETLNFIIRERTLVLNNRKLSCLANVIANEQELAKYGLSVMNLGEINPYTPSWVENELWELPNGEQIHTGEVVKDVDKVMLLLKRYKLDRDHVMNTVVSNLKKV